MPIDPPADDPPVPDPPPCKQCGSHAHVTAKQVISHEADQWVWYCEACDVYVQKIR